MQAIVIAKLKKCLIPMTSREYIAMVENCSSIFALIYLKASIKPCGANLASLQYLQQALVPARTVFIIRLFVHLVALLAILLAASSFNKICRQESTSLRIKSNLILGAARTTQQLGKSANIASVAISQSCLDIQTPDSMICVKVALWRNKAEFS
jgi:hypothetical protein